MELTPREKDKLLIFTAALLAERRKGRGEDEQLVFLARSQFHGRRYVFGVMRNPKAYTAR